MCKERRQCRRRQAMSQRGPGDWQYRGQEAGASAEIQLWNKPCSQGQELEKILPKGTDNRTATKYQHLSKFSEADDKKIKQTLFTFIGCSSSWILHNLISFPRSCSQYLLQPWHWQPWCFEILTIPLWSPLSSGSFLGEINVKLWT